MGGSRSQARFCAVQAIYQWLFGAASVEEIEQQFLRRKEIRTADADLFRQLLYRVTSLRPELDRLLGGYLDRPLDQIDVVEHAILLIGVYEVRYCPEIPPRVAINEAIDLAKRFGAEQGHRYVNAVLDRVASGALSHSTASSTSDSSPP